MAPCLGGTEHLSLVEEQVVEDLAKMIGSSFHVVAAPTLCSGHPLRKKDCLFEVLQSLLLICLFMIMLVI